jgi:metal-responsive CopG/Arc/MetJ family transcriptional regulator
MAVAKVAVSLPSSLLNRIDRVAKKSRLSRSAVIREAVERTFRQRDEDEVLRKAHPIYAEIGEEDRALAETFLSLAAETLPPQPGKRRR